jgi:hypothetical protein
MIGFSCLQSHVLELGARGGIPPKYLRVYNESPQDGAPHIEISSETYSYIVQERGFEFSRKETKDICELLFWILDDASSKYAFDLELDRRVNNQDSRRMAFNIKIEIMKKIDVKWAEMIKRKIEDILIDSPYVDR